MFPTTQHNSFSSCLRTAHSPVVAWTSRSGLICRSSGRRRSCSLPYGQVLILLAGASFCGTQRQWHDSNVTATIGLSSHDQSRAKRCRGLVWCWSRRTEHTRELRLRRPPQRVSQTWTLTEWVPRRNSVLSPAANPAAGHRLEESYVRRNDGFFDVPSSLCNPAIQVTTATGWTLVFVWLWPWLATLAVSACLAYVLGSAVACALARPEQRPPSATGAVTTAVCDTSNGRIIVSQNGCVPVEW